MVGALLLVSCLVGGVTTVLVIRSVEVTSHAEVSSTAVEIVLRPDATAGEIRTIADDLSDNSAVRSSHFRTDESSSVRLPVSLLPCHGPKCGTAPEAFMAVFPQADGGEFNVVVAGPAQIAGLVKYFDGMPGVLHVTP